MVACGSGNDDGIEGVMAMVDAFQTESTLLFERYGGNHMPFVVSYGVGRSVVNLVHAFETRQHHLRPYGIQSPIVFQTVGDGAVADDEMFGIRFLLIRFAYNTRKELHNETADVACVVELTVVEIGHLIDVLGQQTAEFSLVMGKHFLHILAVLVFLEYGDVFATSQLDFLSPVTSDEGEAKHVRFQMVDGGFADDLVLHGVVEIDRLRNDVLNFVVGSEETRKRNRLACIRRLVLLFEPVQISFYLSDGRLGLGVLVGCLLDGVLVFFQFILVCILQDCTFIYSEQFLLWEGAWTHTFCLIFGVQQFLQDVFCP